MRLSLLPRGPVLWGFGDGEHMLEVTSSAGHPAGGAEGSSKTPQTGACMLFFFPSVVYTLILLLLFSEGGGIM